MSGRRARTCAAPVPLEAAEQSAIVQLLEQLGAKVYVLGTKRKRGDHPGTMQTPGVADLIVFLRDRRDPGCQARRLVFIEVKRQRGGRFSQQQIEFREMCSAARVDHVGGSLDAVTEWLSEQCLIPSTRGRNRFTAANLPVRVSPDTSIDKKDRSTSIDLANRSIGAFGVGGGGNAGVVGEGRASVASPGVQAVGGGRGRQTERAR